MLQAGSVEPRKNVRRLVEAYRASGVAHAAGACRARRVAGCGGAARPAGYARTAPPAVGGPADHARPAVRRTLRRGAVPGGGVRADRGRSHGVRHAGPDQWRGGDGRGRGRCCDAGRSAGRPGADGGNLRARYRPRPAGQVERPGPGGVPRCSAGTPTRSGSGVSTVRWWCPPDGQARGRLQTQPHG